MNTAELQKMVDNIFPPKDNRFIHFQNLIKKYADDKSFMNQLAIVLKGYQRRG